MGPRVFPAPVLLVGRAAGVDVSFRAGGFARASGERTITATRDGAFAARRRETEMTNRMRGTAGGAVLCGVLIALALVVTAGPASPGQARPGGRVLIVADEREPMDALAEALRAKGRYQVQYVEPKALPRDLGDCAAVFMYIHGAMTRPTEKALIAYANGGGRLVILHHGIASGRIRNPDWLRLTGIHIAPRNHPKYPWKVLGNTAHTLVNLQPRHYITSHNVTYDRTVEYQSSDWPSLPGRYPALEMKNTEVFLNQHFTDGREKTVLFGFLARDAAGTTIMQDRSGWYKPAGKGWVFYLQPGHRAADFRNVAYCQIILNCLSWQPGTPLADKPAGVK